MIIVVTCNCKRIWDSSHNKVLIKIKLSTTLLYTLPQKKLNSTFHIRSCICSQMLKGNGGENQTATPQLADATYAHILVIESAHKYKVHGPYVSNFPFTSTFNYQSMSIGRVSKSGGGAVWFSPTLPLRIFGDRSRSHRRKNNFYVSYISHLQDVPDPHNHLIKSGALIT